MQRRTRIGVIGGAVCCVILAAIGVAAAAEFEVTVTNLTRGQVFTPILVASHRRTMRASSTAPDSLSRGSGSSRTTIRRICGG